MHIKIYQIDPLKDDRSVKFMNLSFTYKHGDVNPETYLKVFDGDVDCNELESVYKKFNLDHPPAFMGHSLSISDVVETEDGSFFCDEFGFTKIDFDTSLTQSPPTIRVLIVEPDKAPYEANIGKDLKSMQRAVGGMIEAVYDRDEYDGKEQLSAIIVNENGKLEGLPPNRRYYDDVLVGNFFICSVNGDDFDSLTDEQVEKYNRQFEHPEEISEQDVENSTGITFVSF